MDRVNEKLAVDLVVRLANERNDAERHAKVLASLLREAVRYIEVQQAYDTAMTPAQVEARVIDHSRRLSRVEIGHSGCTILASIDLESCRRVIANTLKE